MNYQLHQSAVGEREMHIQSYMLDLTFKLKVKVNVIQAHDTGHSSFGNDSGLVVQAKCQESFCEINGYWRCPWLTDGSECSSRSSQSEEELS